MVGRARRLLGAVVSTARRTAPTAAVIGLPSVTSLWLVLWLSRVDDPTSASLSVVAVGVASLFVGSAQAVWGEQWQMSRRRGLPWGTLHVAQLLAPLAALVTFLVLSAVDLRGAGPLLLVAAPYAAVASVQALLRQRALVGGRERDVAVAEGVGVAVLVAVTWLGHHLAGGARAGTLLAAAALAGTAAVAVYHRRDPVRWGRSPHAQLVPLLVELVGVSVLSQATMLLLATTAALPDVAALRYFITLVAPVFLLSAALRVQAYRQAGTGLAAPVATVALPLAVLAGAVVLVASQHELRPLVLGGFAPDVLALWPLLLLYCVAQLLTTGVTLVRRRRAEGGSAAWLRPAVEAVAAAAAVSALLLGHPSAAVPAWLLGGATTSLVGTAIALLAARAATGERPARRRDVP